MSGWLSLDPPPGWVLHEDPARRVATSPEADARLEWSRLGFLPHDLEEWIRRTLGEGLVSERHHGVTVDGWSVALITAELPVGARGLFAFYGFLEHAAHAALIAPDAAALEQARALVVPRMLAARPAFEGDAAIALFWGDDLPEI